MSLFLFHPAPMRLLMDLKALPSMENLFQVAPGNNVVSHHAVACHACVQYFSS